MENAEYKDLVRRRKYHGRRGLVPEADGASLAWSRKSEVWRRESEEERGRTFCMAAPPLIQAFSFQPSAVSGNRKGFLYGFAVHGLIKNHLVRRRILWEAALLTGPRCQVRKRQNPLS